MDSEVLDMLSLRPPPPASRKEGGGCIRTADNRRRTPPPKIKVTIAGKNEIYNRENLIGLFFGTHTFGSQTPPLLSSYTSLGGGGGGGLYHDSLLCDNKGMAPASGLPGEADIHPKAATIRPPDGPAAAVASQPPMVNSQTLATTGQNF